MKNEIYQIKAFPLCYFLRKSRKEEVQLTKPAEERSILLLRAISSTEACLKTTCTDKSYFTGQQ